MKWRVRFRQEQQNCCPPGKYWLVRTSEVEADSEEEAKKQVMHGWRYNHKIEIKSVERVSNDKQTKQG